MQTTSEKMLLKAVTNNEYRAMVNQLEQQQLPSSIPSFDSSFMGLFTEENVSKTWEASICRSTCSTGGPISFICDETTK
jgi:hypothetical protein